MNGTAIVTGGTGGLGVAVVERLLSDGWLVVVPWVAEHELERLEERGGLELIKADLFEPESVAEVVAAADSPPLSGLVNLVGGFAAGARVHVPPVEQDLFAKVDDMWRTRRVWNDYNLRQERFSLLDPVPVEYIRRG